MLHHRIKSETNYRNIFTSVKWFFSLILLIVFVTPCWSNIYTVCSSGCTKTTIQGVIDNYTLKGDDILQVQADMPGGIVTYTESIRLGSDDHGRLGHPLIIKARSGDTVILDGQNKMDHAFKLDTKNSHITIDGFNIRNYNWHHITLRGYASNDRLDGITVANCHIQINQGTVKDRNTIDGIWAMYNVNLTIKNNNITTGKGLLSYQRTKTPADFYADLQTDGIYIQQSWNSIIEGNQILIRNSSAGHNDCIQFMLKNPHTGEGEGYGVIIRNNICIQQNDRINHKQFIYVEYVSEGEVLIHHNTCWSDTSTGSHGISVVPNNVTTSNAVVKVFNNSIYVNGSAASGIRTDPLIKNPLITNNIVYINSNSDYEVCFFLQGMQSSQNINNNICYKAGGKFMGRIGKTYYSFKDWQTAKYDLNGYFTDPKFIDITSPVYDLHLRDDSPAQNNCRLISEHSNKLECEDLSSQNPFKNNIGAYPNN